MQHCTAHRQDVRQPCGVQPVSIATSAEVHIKQYTLHKDYL